MADLDLTEAKRAAWEYVRQFKAISVHAATIEAVNHAAPHIEAAIADRIETWAAEHKRAGNTQHDNALSMAASLIRSGETNWPGTGDPR